MDPDLGEAKKKYGSGFGSGSPTLHSTVERKIHEQNMDC
jgi:hypothetical protein